MDDKLSVRIRSWLTHSEPSQLFSFSNLVWFYRLLSPSELLP